MNYRFAFFTVLGLSMWFQPTSQTGKSNKVYKISDNYLVGELSSTSSPTTSAKPEFTLEANSTLVTSVGQTAYMPCAVENLGDRAVSWIRRSDLKILSIGTLLYTQDSRFLPLHDPGSDVWMLKVTDVAVDDSGEYECQLSYHDDVETKLKSTFALKVLDSRAHIHESPDLHVQKGSRLRLSCSVVTPSAPPTFVYWYRNNKVLNYSPMVHITDTLSATKRKTSRTSIPPLLVSDAESVSEGDVVSTLMIDDVVKRVHSGNYTCAPSNARPASVMVHVVDDESGPAAMQHGNGVGQVARKDEAKLKTLILAAAIAAVFQVILI